jgi:PAP2 superfamily
MDWRVLYTLGLVLSVPCSAASLVRAQESQPTPPSTIVFRNLPSIDTPAPVEPLILSDVPKASESKVEVVQFSPNMPPSTIDIRNLPSIDTPAPARPLILNKTPKAREPKVDVVQFSSKMPPSTIDIRNLPYIDTPAPAEPLILSDAPKASEPNADVRISPNTGMARLGPPQEPRMISLVDVALKSSAYMDPRYVANSLHPDDPGLWERMHVHCGDQIHRLVNDYKNFYLSENLVDVGIAVAVAAPIANTHADQGIRDWYQRGAGNGQSRGADETAKVFKQFGEYKYAIPAYVAFSFSGNLFSDSPVMAAVGEFGDRSLRALAVGAPAVGILQIGLGSDRPFTQDSHWHPFRSSHGASGHAFVGAVPFLTAAAMTENRALQALFFAGSFGTAWSRIHTDDHYFSQVLLGWSIAYLSVQSVNQTEFQYSRFHIVPVDIPKGVGMGVQVQY